LKEHAGPNRPMPALRSSKSSRQSRYNSVLFVSRCSVSSLLSPLAPPLVLLSFCPGVVQSDLFVRPGPSQVDRPRRLTLSDQTSPFHSLPIGGNSTQSSSLIVIALRGSSLSVCQSWMRLLTSRPAHCCRWPFTSFFFLFLFFFFFFLLKFSKSFFVSLSLKLRHSDERSSFRSFCVALQLCPFQNIYSAHGGRAGCKQGDARCLSCVFCCISLCDTMRPTSRRLPYFSAFNAFLPRGAAPGGPGLSGLG
jgi:hypothetical protein